MLASWVAEDQLSASPVRLALLLVVPRGLKKEMRAAIDRMGPLADPTSVSVPFQSISVVAFSPTRNATWQKTQLMALRQKLYQAAELIRNERRRAGFLFSARHTVTFLQMAAQTAGRTPCPPFDLVKASRHSNPVTPTLSTHLTDVLANFLNDNSTLEQLAIPTVASSLILDHYTPRMHGKPRSCPRRRYIG
jgi:hypothetical protein